MSIKSAKWHVKQAKYEFLREFIIGMRVKYINSRRFSRKAYLKALLEEFPQDEALISNLYRDLMGGDDGRQNKRTAA